MSADKEEQLKEELSDLLQKADSYLDEASANIQAAYHVTCDMIRYSSGTIDEPRAFLDRVRQSLMSSGSDIYKKRKELKDLLNVVLNDDKEDE